MSLREQMILKDGKARPPAVLRKVCIHNSFTDDLPVRARGDMGYDLDFVLGRQEEVYQCIQCGHTIPAAAMMEKYQAYMSAGKPIITGRNYDKVKHDD